MEIVIRKVIPAQCYNVVIIIIIIILVQDPRPAIDATACAGVKCIYITVTLYVI